MWLHYPAHFNKLGSMGSPTPSKLLIGFVAQTAWGSGICHCPQNALLLLSAPCSTNAIYKPMCCC